MNTILLVSIVVVLGVIGIGYSENYYSEPTRGCTEFRTDTEYKGYHCKDSDIYFK